MSTVARVGIALTGHHLHVDEILALAQLADRHRFDPILVDGDEARIPRRPQASLYDGTALCAGVLGRTQHIRAGSIRLPGYAHVVQIARALATLQSWSNGRAIGFFGIGSGRHVQDLGLPRWTAAQRIAALEESLSTLRELWRGEPVRRQGRFVELRDITAPRPASPIPIVVAAARPRALRVADRWADVWDANLPPLSRFLEPARARLSRPIETWMWIFARPGASEPQAIAAYRAHCPWFPELAGDEYRRCLLFGDPHAWPDRLEALCGELAIDVPVLDLIGLSEACARAAITACGPAQPRPMA